MNPSSSTDAVLLALCFGSLVTTGCFLLLSIFSRISFRLKTRLLRIFFSLGLTAVVVGFLARTTVSAAPFSLADGAAAQASVISR
jgi:membrane-associated PAP2 superfamily phosphatase